MLNEDEIQKRRQDAIDQAEKALEEVEAAIAKDPKFLATKRGKVEAGLRLPLPNLLTAIVAALATAGTQMFGCCVERVYVPIQGESDRLDAFYTFLACNTIDLVTGIRSSKGRLYMLVVDDEGLLKQNAQSNPLASILAGRDLVGHAMFVRDHEGEDLDPQAKAARVDHRNATSDPSLN